MQFETDFSCSLKELKKANRARILVMIKSNWLFSLLILIGIPAIINGPGIIEGDKATIISWLTAPFIILVAGFIAIDMASKMVFNKNQIEGKVKLHYTFYNDEFQMNTPLVKNTIRFDALRGIDEDKDFFFLKLSPSKILVVQKQNCSPELIAFLQDKAVTISSKGKRN